MSHIIRKHQLNGHIDDFYKCVALVFTHLYSAFPQEVDVCVDELEPNLQIEQSDNYAATVRFLQREGLLRYQELLYETYKGAVLTAKSLSLLETTQDNENTLLVQQISLALEKNDNAAIKSIVRELIKLSVH